MIGNHRLKHECKQTLDAIRKALPRDECCKIEEHLRHILALTKQLMSNARVSPEDHQALLLEVEGLKREQREHSQVVASFQKELRSVETLRTTLRDKDAAVERLADTLTDAITTPAFASLRTLLGLIDECGEGRFLQWIATKHSDLMAQDDNDLSVRGLLALAIAVTTASDNEVSEDLISNFSRVLSSVVQ